MRTHDVVAVDQTKRELSPGDQIRAIAVTGRQLDAIIFERVHERLSALIAPQNEERRYLRRCRTEQRIGEDRFGPPLGVRVRKHRIRLCADILVDNEDARARGKTRPIAIWILEACWDPVRIRRDVRGGDALLPQYLRPHRLIRPIDIRLWIVLLCDQAVHSARALGLLGVIDRTDFDASISLEIFDDWLRKNLVVAHIQDDGGRLRSG